MPKPDLDTAYALNSLDDTKRMYSDWAETYDQSFAQDMDFVVPARVAEAYDASGAGGPVLDFGCGTGLVGAALAQLDIGPVDGADLSPQMLAVAARKGVYRELIEGDVLDGYALPHGPYAGIVSSGTFTNGHVGPDAIDALLMLARPGAQFALSINSQHFRAAGFAAKFETLKGRIQSLTLPETRFYGPGNTGPHKDDTGFIATFRKM